MKPACNLPPALSLEAPQAEASAQPGSPANLRLLKWNEVVCRGDFVPDDHQGFELWEGPAGFRADSFMKPVYRRSTAPKE